MIRPFLILFLLGISLKADSQFIGFFTPTLSTGNYLTPDLLASWKFEEPSGNVSDNSGNGHTLVISNTLPSVPGVVGLTRQWSHLDFTEFFSVAATTNDFLFTNAFTITAWADFSSATFPTFDMTVLGVGDFAGSDFAWWLMKDYGTPDDSIYFYWSTNGTFDPALFCRYIFDGSISSGKHFIAVRSDGTNVRLVARHESETSFTTNAVATLGGSISTTATTLRVGEINGSDIHDLAGEVDEVFIWKRYLSDCNLEWLFTAGDFDSPGFGVFSYANFNSNICVNP